MPCLKRFDMIKGWDRTQVNPNEICDTFACLDTHDFNKYKYLIFVQYELAKVWLSDIFSTTFQSLLHPSRKSGYFMTWQSKCFLYHTTVVQLTNLMFIIAMRTSQISQGKCFWKVVVWTQDPYPATQTATKTLQDISVSNYLANHQHIEISRLSYLACSYSFLPRSVWFDPSNDSLNRCAYIYREPSVEFETTSLSYSKNISFACQTDWNIRCVSS